ncbi:MAG: hypothetical protein AAGI48_15120 [Verrucomicrobiota bacterium]
MIAIVLEGIFDIVKGAFIWVLERVEGIGRQIIEGIIGNLDVVGVPDSYMDQIRVYVDEINYFFPLAEIVTMASALLALYILVRTTRWIIKLIPTVG